MKITPDTNVLISGTFWTGDSFRILEKLDEGAIIIVLSEEIVEEYARVLKSDEIIEKITNKELTANKIMQEILMNCIIVQPTEKVSLLKDDPNDNKILECALAGNVDYIVTQDKHLLNLKEFEGIKIVTPKKFLKIIDR